MQMVTRAYNIIVMIVASLILLKNLSKRMTTGGILLGSILMLIGIGILVKDFIEDDNMDWIIPMPFKIKGEWYSYNKEEPGVYIKVLNK